MIISNIPGLSSMSMVKAKVDLYNGSTLVKTCTCGDVLSDFTVTREGDNSKFFGFGICHKLDVNFIDFNKELTSVTVGNTAEIGLGDGTLWDAPYPTFYIQELQRDEKASTIKATAYDKLYEAGEYSFDDLGLVTPYCFVDIAQAVANKLGLTLNIDTNIYAAFRVACLAEPNLDEASTKDLRSVLNWIAEATQSIYFVNYRNELVFKRFDIDGAPVTHITQNSYYELNTKTPKTLTAICSTTELGDNLEAYVDGEGVTQYIRSNPFLELREDLASILDAGIAALGGFTITQFDCDWVGNYLLEPCDKIALSIEDGSDVYSYLLSDSVTYGGTLNEVTSWEFTEQTGDTFANPTNIGEKITQTFAKVDKVNKKIELLVSDVSETKENVASLTMTTNAINLLVTEHEEKIEAFEELETGQIVDRMAQIEIDLDGIETTVSSNTTQIQAANTEIAGVKQTTTSNTSRISAIETNLDSINLSVSNQSSKITTLETTTQTQGTAISGLTTTTTNQGNAISDLTADVAENAAGISTLTETTEEHTEKIGKIEVDINSIDLSVQNQTTKITTLETTTQTQGTAIDGLSESVGTLTETTTDHTEQISALTLNADSIAASIKEVETKTTESYDSVAETVEKLAKEVNLKMSSEEVEIAISSSLENGIDKVTTSTGFTFDSKGLNISKSGSELVTLISEDGMTIEKSGSEVLVADNQGVRAEDLHATTYLIIGDNSRFENFGNSRTACFWIGGNN